MRAMFCRLMSSCGRFSRRRRLRCYRARGGKSDGKGKGYESFTHGREGKQAVRLQSTHFQ